MGTGENSQLNRWPGLRNNAPFVVTVLIVLLISVGCFLQTERTDYIKNDRGWQFWTHSRRWETTLSDMIQKVKVVIILPEKLDVWQKGSVVAKNFNESEYDEVRLEFWASGKSTGAYALSVQVNGQEVKRYPQGIRGNARWHSIPLEGPVRADIRDAGKAEVIFNLSGAPNPETDYVTFYGDAAVDSRNSFLFDVTHWTQDDLSKLPGDQQGEFYVRLAYSKSLFTNHALTTERIVIPLLLLNILSLLVLFRKEINSFKVSEVFSALVETLRANKTVPVLLSLILLLALSLRVYFVIYQPQPQILADAARYDTIARNVVSGYGLSEAPPQPSILPLYGYPLFLAWLYSVFGQSPEAVYLVQAVLGSLLCLGVFGIAYELFDNNKYISLAAALLVSLFSPFIEYTGRLLTETLATFTLALFVYLFILALKSAQPRLVFLSGVAFGLAVISRDLFFYFVIFILMTAFIILWPRREAFLRFAALFLVGGVLACSPLLVRNVHVFGSFSFEHLVRLPLAGTFAVVTDAEKVAESDDLVQLMSEKPEEWREAISKSPGEALQEGSTNIIESLVTDPLGYLTVYVGRWLPRIELLWYPGSWYDETLFGLSLRHLLAFRRLIVFLALLGALACLSAWRKYLLLDSLIAYPSLVHAMFLAYPRYSIPWMPYVCIFATAGIAALVTIVRRARSKSLALVLTGLIALTVSMIGAEEQSFLDLLGPLTAEGLLVIELCLIVLACFLLFRHRKKIPNTVINASAVLVAFGYMTLRGQTMPLPPEETFSVLVDANHYVGHLIDLPPWTQGYDSYYLKMKLDGTWIEPTQKKYGIRVFANGEMIKEYPINNEVIHGLERIPIDKRFIEGQKKLYVSLQVFGAPDVFENYLGVYIRRNQNYGLSVFNDSTRYLSMDWNEEQNGTFLIGLEMAGKGAYRDVDLWLGSRLNQAEKLALLRDESGKWYSLGDEIALVGYDVDDTVKAGEVLRPRLYWQARTRIDKDYTVFVQLLDEAGNIRAQQDCQPQRGSYPTSLWQRGEVVWDAHAVPIPPDVAIGTYQLVVGMYLLETMERLPVLDAKGGRWPYDMIPLGEVKVQQLR